MNLEQLKYYLLTKTESTQDFPFGADVYVFKVKKKMFALIGHREGKMMLNLKCDPDESWMLRDIFPAITPGYHMNKLLWISIYFDGTVPESEVERLIDNSYQLVVNTLSKKLQLSLL